MSDGTVMDLKYDEGEIEHRRNLVKSNPNRYFTKKNKTLMNAKIVEANKKVDLLLIFVDYDW
jgi:hypothetical protein